VVKIWGLWGAGHPGWNAQRIKARLDGKGGRTAFPFPSPGGWRVAGTGDCTVFFDRKASTGRHPPRRFIFYLVLFWHWAVFPVERGHWTAYFLWKGTAGSAASTSTAPGTGETSPPPPRGSRLAFLGKGGLRLNAGDTSSSRSSKWGRTL
jgi:hypothetical protein